MLKVTYCDNPCKCGECVIRHVEGCDCERIVPHPRVWPNYIDNPDD